MLRLGQSQPVLKVVDDQRARPTASGDVAAFLLSQAPRLARDCRLMRRSGGCFRFANAGTITRYEMAKAIFAMAWPDRPPPWSSPCPQAPSRRPRAVD